MASAQYGDEIWIAKGTYFPSNDSTDRGASFIIPSGVKLYGGFHANETELSQRDWETNTSILSGAIDDGSFNSHSIHVLTLINTDSTTLIDGLTIEEGEAFAFASEGQDKRHGSAIYHIQTVMNLKSEFRVRNCRFRNHKAYEEPFFNLEGGGTIYNESLSGDIFVEIENCIFENIEGNYKILYNKTNTENDSISVLIKNCSMQNSMGAGDIVKSKSDKGKIKLSFENTSFKKFELCDEFIFCEGDSTLFDISFLDCLIDSIGYGNIYPKNFILNEGVNSEYKINFHKNTYSNNRKIGGIVIEDDSLTTLILNADSCYFSKNSFVFDVDQLKEVNMEIKNCYFTDTIASQIVVHRIYEKSDISLEACTFENSYMVNAIAYNRLYSSFFTPEQNLKINNCQFNNNEETASDAGMISIIADQYTNVEISNCTFSDNFDRSSAITSFGVTYSLGIEIILVSNNLDERGSISIDSCIFKNNTASVSPKASAISTTQAFSGFANNTIDLNINNCTFSGNQTQDIGSVYLKNVDAKINNCLFYNNEVEEGDGIIWISKEEEIEETNTIFTNCTFADTANTTVFNEASNAAFRNCIFSSDSVLVSSDVLFSAYTEFNHCVFTQDNCPTESEFCENNIFSTSIDFNNPEEGNYSISLCSPAVDFGNSIYVEEAEMLLDLNGANRIQDSAPDAGAYEVMAFTAEIVSISPDTCDSIPNGVVEINTSSFCPPLTYSWAEMVSSELTGLPSGDYPLTINDANNRQIILNVSIPDTLSFQLSSEITMPQCLTSTPGIILTSVDAEPFTYDFLWDDNSMEQNRTDILAGEYSLTVTNAVGCKDSLTFEITVGGNIDLELETIDITCHDTTDGEISVLSEGGFDELNYNWEDGSLEQTRINLDAGMYTVTVSDEYGCSGEAATELLTPTEIEIESLIINASTSISNDGSIEIEEISGGYFPYSLLWNAGTTDTSLTDISSGDYSLTILDSLGCQGIFEFYVDFNSSSIFIENNKLNIFPNPVLRGEKIQIFDIPFEESEYQWKDMQGRNISSGKIPINSNVLPAPGVSGIYILSVYAKNEEIYFAKVIVN